MVGSPAVGSRAGFSRLLSCFVRDQELTLVRLLWCSQASSLPRSRAHREPYERVREPVGDEWEKEWGLRRPMMGGMDCVKLHTAKSKS